MSEQNVGDSKATQKSDATEKPEATEKAEKAAKAAKATTAELTKMQVVEKIVEQCRDRKPATVTIAKHRFCVEKGVLTVFAPGSNSRVPVSEQTPEALDIICQNSGYFVERVMQIRPTRRPFEAGVKIK